MTGEVKRSSGTVSLHMVHDLAAERQASPMMGTDEEDDDLNFVENVFEVPSKGLTCLVMSDGSLRWVNPMQMQAQASAERFPSLMKGKISEIFESHLLNFNQNSQSQIYQINDDLTFKLKLVASEKVDKLSQVTQVKQLQNGKGDIVLLKRQKDSLLSVI